MIRFGAVYCIYDDFEYLRTSVESFLNMDKILFLISDVPWYGEACDNSDTIEYVTYLCSVHKNMQLIQGHWTTEAEQRNFGLSEFTRLGIDYCFIVDGDEIYHTQHVENIKDFVQANSSIYAFHINWNTYWKKSYHVINPREKFKPVVVVKASDFSFEKNRNGTTSVIKVGDAIIKTKANYNGIVIPSDVAICYHLSYARSDEQIKRKIETFSHAPEVKKEWFEETWLKWTPEKTNLHPVTPTEYRKAVSEDFLNLPTQLKTFIKIERFRNSCSIIIPNWNSCLLLQRCLKLVEENTLHKSYEVIIVDNGSKQDNSVEYLKSLKPEDFKFPFKIIYNEENLGFAGGVNAGIVAANPDSDIVLLNADAEVHNDWLYPMYDTMNKVPNCGLVGPLGNVVGTNYQSEGMVREDTMVPNLHFFCVLIFREVLNKIGLLDTCYGLGGYEDNDFCMRARLSGYVLHLSAKSLVKHKAHQVFDLNGLDWAKLETENREKFLNKFFGIMLCESMWHDFFKDSVSARGLRLVI